MTYPDNRILLLLFINNQLPSLTIDPFGRYNPDSYIPDLDDSSEDDGKAISRGAFKSASQVPDFLQAVQEMP